MMTAKTYLTCVITVYFVLSGTLTQGYSYDKGKHRSNMSSYFPEDYLTDTLLMLKTLILSL